MSAVRRFFIREQTHIITIVFWNDDPTERIKKAWFFIAKSNGIFVMERSFYFDSILYCLTLLGYIWWLIIIFLSPIINSTWLRWVHNYDYCLLYNLYKIYGRVMCSFLKQPILQACPVLCCFSKCHWHAHDLTLLLVSE